jgi:hypothetical protein
MPGFDEGIERLECVSYATPIPRDRATLTVLSIVFDKIHFPGVYIPKGDYDPAALEAEIERLRRLPPTTRGVDELVGMLSFVPLRLPFRGVATAHKIGGRGHPAR